HTTPPCTGYVVFADRAIETQVAVIEADTASTAGSGEVFDASARSAATTCSPAPGPMCAVVQVVPRVHDVSPRSGDLSQGSVGYVVPVKSSLAVARVVI